MIETALSLLFALYFAAMGFILQKPLVQVFHFNKTYRVKLFGSFLAFIFASWLSGLAVVFYKVDLLVSIIILVLTGLASLGLYFFARKYEFPDPLAVVQVTPKYDLKWLHISLVGLFSALVAYGFYLLAISRTGVAVLTPWQTIKPSFIYIFALAAMVLGLLIYTKYSHKYVLILAIILSFLQHSYLPLTTDLFYGADGWRHIATEERIYRGEPVETPKISDSSPDTNLTTVVGRFAYSQLWGMSVLIAKVLNVDLITVNKWFLPVLWSVMLPILLFEIGRSFGWTRRRSTVLVWLSFLPFAWQVAGSFTLPVNFGFLVWLFAQLLMFKRSENPDHYQLQYLFGIGIMISFGYTLYALIFWAGMALFEMIRWRLDFTRAQVGFMVILGSLFLPIIEWKFGQSLLSSTTTFWEGAKQVFGTLTGYYLASGPRPHDISAGNIFINEPPSYAFVSNIFISYRWWIVAFMIIFWIIFLIGVRLSMAKGFDSLPDYPGDEPVNIYRSQYCWLLVFGISVLFGYILSRYFLPGEHLLTRRLDPTLAFLVLTIVFVAVTSYATVGKYKFFVIPAFIVSTLFLSASYSLGPDTRNVSLDEYKAVQYIAGESQYKPNHCVVADTYVLLALEAESRGKIIGGGFPISHNFEQPELSRLQMNLTDLSIVEVNRALRATNADSCYIIIKTDGQISYFIKNVAEKNQFGSVSVWKYNN